MLLGTDNYVLPAHFKNALKTFDPAEPLILGIRGHGCLEFRVQDLGLRVQGLEFRI